MSLSRYGTLGVRFVSEMENYLHLELTRFEPKPIKSSQTTNSDGDELQFLHVHQMGHT